jgi:hypothetical protein
MKIVFLFILLQFSFTTIAQISIKFPVTRAIIQRNNANQASLNIAGNIIGSVDRVEARLIPRAEQTRMDTILPTNWQMVQLNPKSFFSGRIAAKGGWYDLKVRTIKNGLPLDSLVIERVGIGEVFAYIGHSNAQGGAYGITGPDATDDRVSCIPVGHEPNCNGLYPVQPAISSDSLWCKYLQTADIQYLPNLKFAKVSLATGIAPFCGKPWFWSILGDSLSHKLNVPILLYGAAFGGTNSEHWYKASQGIYFDHSFVKSRIAMPYINLKNILQLYVPLTGIRGILCLNGVNERFDTQQNIQFWMEGYIAQSRLDSQISNLAWMIALDSYLLDHSYSPPPSPINYAPRNAQIAVRQQANNYFGPDLDQITDNNGGEVFSDRPDGIHFGNLGIKSAANAWTNAIIAPSFIKISIPKLAQSFSISTTQSGNWKQANNWNCKCYPQPYHSTTIEPNHVMQVDSVKARPLNIIIKGAVNLKNQGVLGF